MSREHRNQALVLANNTTESRRIADTLSDNVVKVENPKWSYVKQEKYVCSTLRTQTHTHIRKIFYVRTMYPVVIHGECKYMENYTRLFWYSEEKFSFYYYEIDNDFRYFGLNTLRLIAMKLLILRIQRSDCIFLFIDDWYRHSLYIT